MKKLCTDTKITMAHSFPPKPWTQQFHMLSVTVKGWYDCVEKKKPIVFVTRGTFISVGFHQATVSNYMHDLRTDDLAQPVDLDSKEARNFLTPTKSGLLQIRNYFDALIEEESMRLHTQSQLLGLEELKQRCEEIYAYLFGNPGV